jgi:WD40 repeat protein
MPFTRARAPVTQLAAGDGTLMVFDPLAGKALVTLRRAHAPPRAPPTGSSFAAAPPRPDAGCVTAAALSPCGRLLASGGSDCAVRVWAWEEGRLLACFAGAHAVPQATLLWAPDGALLVAVGRDAAPRVWRTGSALTAAGGAA